MTPSARKTIFALATLAVGAAAGCTSAAYDSAYYDPYTYYSYYPADVYYSSYYWADPYYYSYLDYGPSIGTSTGMPTGKPPMTPPPVTPTGTQDGGTLATGLPVSPTDGGATVIGSVGDAIRALARGESVCGDQVTVTPKTQPNPCASAAVPTIRGGATVVFASCALPNGGTVSGTVDVQTTRTASDPTCSTTTTITIAHTTTITNLVYTGRAGRRLVIPNQTGTGTTSFVNGQRPATAAAHLTGRLQIVEASGALTADKSYDGDVTITPSSTQDQFAIDGTLTLSDADLSGTTVLTATGLTRSSSCCRPTGGTVSVARTGTNAFAKHTWTFDGATCGAARFDNDPITLATCL